MKTLLALYAGFALTLLSGALTPGQAAGTEPEMELPGATPLGPSMPKDSGRGKLLCAYEDHKNTDVYVLLCRFENSESCPLIDPTPLATLMRKYEGVKFLMIGSTPDGCSRLTFTGSLKTN